MCHGRWTVRPSPRWIEVRSATTALGLIAAGDQLPCSFPSASAALGRLSFLPYILLSILHFFCDLAGYFLAFLFINKVVFLELLVVEAIIEIIVECISLVPMDSQITVPGGEVMNVDEEAPENMHVERVGSPTEIVAESENEPDHSPCADPAVKMEKRKRRDPAHDGHARAVPDDDEGDLDSPTKRPLRCSDAPLSASEMRAMLSGHLTEMKSAWGAFQSRIEKVENDQSRCSFEVTNLQGRTRVLEKDAVNQKKTLEQNSTAIDNLAQEVQGMKVRLDNMQVKAPGGPPPPGPPVHDPWADFLRLRDQQPVRGVNDFPGVSSKPGASTNPDGDRGDMLSEDEKKTLVVGGWLQDTRRATIEEESMILFSNEEIKPLLDSDKLAVFGPRRSVGMLKFLERPGECYGDVKERMWKVVKAVAALKTTLPSTRVGGDAKVMWTSFVKTKNARARSAHVSMIRRVAVGLAKDNACEAGGIGPSVNCADVQSYDCDWSLGTIWCGQEKLGSATHRQPREDEVITIGAGWISVSAVARCIGYSSDEVKSAFEKAIPAVFEEEGDYFFSFVCKTALGKTWSMKLLVKIMGGIHLIQNIFTGLPIVHLINGIGRVILGSLHCHTGVPNAVYQAAVIEFAKACPRKFRHLPLLCGIDANEVPRWNEDEDERAFVESGSSNLNLLVSEMLNIGASACGPRECDRSSPTHFPRDITRAGRHIDMIFSRQANVGSLNIDAERRHVIGSDHALLYGELSTATGRSKHVWGNDSRPRWVVQELPGDFTIVDDDDLQQLAKKYTKPLFSKAYRDNDEIKQAISDAKLDMKPTSWKRVHRLRRAARKQWHDERRTSILNGDWGEYRALQKEKHRCRGWWGSLLAERSALDLTRDVVDHLSSKIVDEKGVNWDDELTSLVQGVTSDGDFVPFTILDVRVELQQMKTRSAVGPGGISVHLLREIASHDTLQYGLLDLINHIVRTQEQPSAWEESFLALLAKCKSPSRPSDLRPICVSSAFHKLISRLVCARCLPLVRRGSRISCCGKGRQSADLVGSISRIRDVTKEWCEPLLLCKLDVAGAFDRIDRRRVAKLLLDRLGGLGCSSELKFLLKQLHTHTLVGNVPGGRTIKLRPNIGIKQGAPESAELFGLVVDSLLTDLVSHPKWTEFGDPFAELGVTLLFYQDDIFLVENDLPKLARRIRAVGRCLQQAGLQLATDKTKIVANEHYKGCRRVRVAQDEFQVAPLGDSLKVLGIPFSLSHDASEQAKVLIGRTREALHAHLDILVATCIPSPVVAVHGMVETAAAVKPEGCATVQLSVRWLVQISAHMNMCACMCGLEDLENAPVLNLLLHFVMPRGDFFVVCFLFGLGGVQLPTAAPGDDPYLTGCWDNEWGTDGLSAPATSSTSAPLDNVTVAPPGPQPGDGPTTSATPLTSCPASSSPSTTWTYEDYAAHMANAWDEEISLALQEDELDTAIPEITPEATHVPTTVLWSVQSTLTWEAQQESTSRPSSSSASPWTPSPSTTVAVVDIDHVNENPLEQDNINVNPLEQNNMVHNVVAAPVVDWWEAIKDRRNIRGRSTHNMQPVTSCTDVPAYARDPSSLLGPTASSGRPAYNNLPLDGGVSSSSSSASGHDDPWLAWTSSDGSGVNLSDGDSEPGVIQRFGKWRVGRDRWHRPDGSLINRGRQNLDTSEVAASATLELPTIAEEENGLAVSGVHLHSGEPVVTVSTAAGEMFHVRSSQPNQEACSDANSTTASNGTGTSSSASSAVGFWQHGVWVARPRTAQEQRAHIGGRGQQRTQRKQQRVRDWQNGLWKPAWLVQYARDRDRRLRDHEHATTVPEPGVETTASTQADDDWIQDPVTGWWSRSALGLDLLLHYRYTVAYNYVDNVDTVFFAFYVQYVRYKVFYYRDKVVLLLHVLYERHFQYRMFDYFNHYMPRHKLLPYLDTYGGDTHLPWLLAQHSFIGQFRTAPEEEDESEVASMMQLTPAERTRLAEDGVPVNIIDRLEAYFESLQRQQDADRGPEGRWAMSRVHQRMQDGMEALDTLFEIVGRRLVPRGYWPIQRLPSSATVRTSMYQWAQNLGRMVVDLVEAHLQTPLQADELAATSQFLRDHPPPESVSDASASIVLGAPDSSLPGPDHAAGAPIHGAAGSATHSTVGHLASSSSSSGPSTSSRDRSRSPTVRVERGPANEVSDTGGGIGQIFPDFDGSQVGNESSTFFSPECYHWLTSEMRPVLEGELRGVWAEPATGSADVQPASSTTSSTTTTIVEEDFTSVVLVQSHLVLKGDSILDEDVLFHTYVDLHGDMFEYLHDNWPSSLESSVSALAHGGQIDIIDFVRRLLDRQRKLRREEQLLGEALEEAITWLPHPQQALPLNAAEYERFVYNYIARLSASGSASGSADPPPPDTQLCQGILPPWWLVSGGEPGAITFVAWATRRLPAQWLAVVTMSVCYIWCKVTPTPRCSTGLLTRHVQYLLKFCVKTLGWLTVADFVSDVHLHASLRQPLLELAFIVVVAHPLLDPVLYIVIAVAVLEEVDAVHSFVAVLSLLLRLAVLRRVSVPPAVLHLTGVAAVMDLLVLNVWTELLAAC
ncbi:unnamed protein product [Symbiodinium microadriaticum]|nr:unnamed protein product [Symbiodinium microadriaticum]